MSDKDRSRVTSAVTQNCETYLTDAFGAGFPWLSGPLQGEPIQCDLPLGHVGDHEAGDMYRWPTGR